MRVVKLALEEHTITALDAQAAAMDISRAEVIRRCIAESAPSRSLKPDEYNQLVRNAYSFIGGGIDRRQFEGLVAYLFNQLHAINS